MEPKGFTTWRWDPEELEKWSLCRNPGLQIGGRTEDTLCCHALGRRGIYFWLYGIQLQNVSWNLFLLLFFEIEIWKGVIGSRRHEQCKRCYCSAAYSLCNEGVSNGVCYVSYHRSQIEDKLPLFLPLDACEIRSSHRVFLGECTFLLFLALFHSQ
jgi:hypothetical protein